MKKTHHAPDYAKNKTADVIKKGSSRAVSDTHWEMDCGDSVFPRYGDNPKDAFLAGNGRVRPQPHVMVNECDH